MCRLLCPCFYYVFLQMTDNVRGGGQRKWTWNTQTTRRWFMYYGKVWLRDLGVKFCCLRTLQSSVFVRSLFYHHWFYSWCTRTRSWHFLKAMFTSAWKKNQHLYPECLIGGYKKFIPTHVGWLKRSLLGKRESAQLCFVLTSAGKQQVSTVPRFLKVQHFV